MAGKAKRPSREQTDTRLGIERGKTDEELARRTKAAERQADDVKARARKNTSELLRTSRQRTDARLRESQASAAERVRTEAARLLENGVLRDEQARADEITARERQERARLLADVLTMERGETDRSLLLERVDADAIVAKRDEFLGMVSHDLRNLLAGIGLNVGQLIRHASHADAGKKVVASAANIQRILLRMNRLVGDLLDVVSIEVGKLMIVAEDHDAHRVVEEIIETFLPIAAAKDISLKAQTIADSCPARFDHQRILQVLGNLLTNSVKFSPVGSTIQVSLERRGAEVRISVADEGPGIPVERLQTIFDRFAQGAGERTGLGLGLYISRCIVEAHGGRIWAESEVGRGSTFHFTLPPAPGR